MNCGKRMGRMKETKKFKDNWQKYFGPALGIGAVFLIWYLVCRMEMVSAYVLPSPARVWTSFLKMVKTGELWRDISISFLRVMKGFAIAFLFAFVLGMFRALFPGSSVYYEYIVQFFRNVPPLSMIPLLILSSRRGVMREFVNGKATRTLGWITVSVIVALNLLLLWQTFTGA